MIKLFDRAASMLLDSGHIHIGAWLGLMNLDTTF